MRLTTYRRPQQLIERSLKRNHNLDAPRGVNGRNSDNRLIRDLFGWEQQTRLANGMATTFR